MKAVNVCLALPGIASGFGYDQTQQALPRKVVLPGSGAYATQNVYWSQRQSDLDPACFVTPENTFDVSVALKTLISLAAPFTVKGGGQTAFAGGSSISGGVTVDLFKMTEIAVSKEQLTVSIGPGNRWSAVTKAAVKQGLAVLGGRVGTVGVSGFLLGGGLSYFSGQHGMACDNLRNYEVVLASGEIVNASPDSHPDLYWALRGGGGSDFGIVTRFDLEAFEQEDLWSKTMVFPGATNDTFFDSFYELINRGLPLEPGAHTFASLTYMEMLGAWSLVSNFYHSTPPADTSATPEIFKPFEALPAVYTEVTVTNVSQLVDTLGDTPADQPRKMWMDVTLQSKSGAIFAEMAHIIEAYWNKLRDAGVEPSTGSALLIFQPLPTNLLKQMAKNGGNALGLLEEDGPLVVVQVITSWVDPQMDQAVSDGSREAVGRIEQLAAARGELHPYQYMNYAEKGQDVFKSYDVENHQRLQDVAAKVDS